MRRSLRVPAFLLAAASAALSRGAARAGDAEPPSVLLIVTDDQRADCLGAAGHPLLRTPHLDRLASQGVLFENAFVTTSICSVSRASIVTGLYSRKHRVGDFRTALPPEVLERSFPFLLRAAGYRVGCFGKWGVGGKSPRETFDVWDAWGDQGDYYLREGADLVHNSDWIALRAEAFLRGQPPGRPFCLLLSYKAPHDPYVPADAEEKLFQHETVPVPRTATASHFEAMPAFIQVSEGRHRLLEGHRTPGEHQDFLKEYLRCVAGVDRSVGKVLGVLEELGLDASTLVVFTSDNGFFLGEHGLSGKWLMHEESIRVPLIVRPPGLEASLRGRRRRELVLNIDLAPTILEAAGLAIPSELDGRSLLPLLEGRQPPWRQDFLYEHHFHYHFTIPRTEGVRSTRWKYITYLDTEPFEELYDLEADPFEERNLACQPAHRPLLESLRARREELSCALPPPPVPD